MQTFLTRRQAADYLTERGLPIAWRTLQKMATTGGGPIYQLFGKRAVYTYPNLDAYAAERLSAPRRSTSDVSEAA
jgi:hypothetical protein